MANSTLHAKIIFKAIDQALAPIRKITAGVNKATAAMKKLNTQQKRNTKILASYTRSMKNFGKSVKNAGFNVSSLRSAITTVAATSVGLGYGFKRLFLDAGMEAERLGFTLRSLADGDMRKVAQWKEFLIDLDAKSAFGLTDLTKAFTTMKVMGMDPANGSLQQLADKLASMGKGSYDMQLAVLQLSQAFAKNNLEMQDLKPLTAMGLDVYAALAKAAGKTREEIEQLDFRGQGARAILTALRYWGQESAGMAQEYSRTVTGMFDKLGSLWKRFAVAVSEAGLFDALGNKLTSIIERIENAIKTGAFQQYAKEISDTFVKIGETLEAMWVIAEPILSLLSSSIMLVADAVAGLSKLLNHSKYMFSFLFGDKSKPVIPPKTGVQGDVRYTPNVEQYAPRNFFNREPRTVTDINVTFDDKGRPIVQSVKSKGAATIRANVGYAGAKI